MNQIKLNLGCGTKKLNGYLNVDWKKTSAVDIVQDLNKFPYPFKTESVDEVLLDNVLEHLDDLIKVMEEIYRISKHGAIIKIYVPYAKSDGAFKDPTHKHFFLERTFQYFEPEHPLNFYSKARFRVKKVRLECFSNNMPQKLRNILPFRAILKYPFLNMYDQIYFELQCIK
jgi:predicted SAM-dependent methyltransferase